MDLLSNVNFHFVHFHLHIINLEKNQYQFSKDAPISRGFVAIVKIKEYFSIGTKTNLFPLWELTSMKYWTLTK